MKKYCIGVDIGGTSVKMGLFDTNGNVLKKWEIGTRKEGNGKYIISDVAESILELLSEEGISKEEVTGAGMGVPGPTKADGHVAQCVNLGWKECWPGRELSELIGVPVKVGNDANVAALGETWKGGGEGYSDVVMLTLGTGVGGGVVLNGKIISGNRGVGGELGHITMNPQEAAVCNCGNHGCLEQYASATGIVRIANHLLEERVSDSVLRKTDGITAKDVFDAAKAGDAIATEAAETLGSYLGIAMATVSMTVDPDAFVIGGGVSKAGEYLIHLIQNYYAKHMVICEEKADIVLAKLGNDAGIYGAAKLALEEER